LSDSVSLALGASWALPFAPTYVREIYLGL
jgi:hypothetical protein